MPNDLPGAPLTEFPAASETDWREAVAKVLKGGPFERLRTPTADGYTIEPIYRAAQGQPFAGTRGTAPWAIVQRVDLPDPAAANEQALADLAGGATGLELVFALSVRARGYGIGATDPASLERLLAGVMLDLITIRIDAGDASQSVAQGIVRIAAENGILPTNLRLAIAADPIGAAIRVGGSTSSLDQQIADHAAAAATLAASGIAGPVLTVDGRIWHEAGASRAETLGAMLASAVAYWRALAAMGLDVSSAAARIGFTLAVDQSQFSAMAEIRALRLMWARATAAAGLAPQVASIHAETSFRMLSRLDANTNLIRTTIAAFAAGVGGADSVTVLPFSAANGLPDAFARRLARNIQSVLLEESNLYRVIDPAAGSGRVEAETQELAAAAWSVFRDLDAAGGIVAGLKSGALQTRIAATAAARAREIARRKQPLTGVSEFPILGQAPVAVLDAPPVPVAPAAVLAETFPALPAHRLSEPFEALRTVASASSPKVFLANLGRIADFNVRSAWVKNLFEVGGIEAIGNDGFETLDELVAAFQASGATAACVASSDAVYADLAESALRSLKAAGAGPVFLAGRPADAAREAKLGAAGADVFLFAGQDIIAVLQDAQTRIARSH